MLINENSAVPTYSSSKYTIYTSNNILPNLKLSNIASQVSEGISVIVIPILIIPGVLDWCYNPDNLIRLRTTLTKATQLIDQIF